MTLPAPTGDAALLRRAAQQAAAQVVCARHARPAEHQLRRRDEHVSGHAARDGLCPRLAGHELQLPRVAWFTDDPPAQCTVFSPPPDNGQGGAAHPTPTVGGGPNLLQVHGHPERTLVQSGRFLAPADEPLHDPVLLRTSGSTNAATRREPRSSRPPRSRSAARGQALVEFALVFPLFLLVLFSVISFGLYVFYNQQLANAAREAARTRRSIARPRNARPSRGWIRPDPTSNPTARPTTGAMRQKGAGRQMTGVAHSKVWGMAPAPGLAGRLLVRLRGPGSGNYDALPESPNVFTDCTINRVNPKTDPDEPRLPGAADHRLGVTTDQRRPTGTTRPAISRRRQGGVAIPDDRDGLRLLQLEARRWPAS